MIVLQDDWTPLFSRLEEMVSEGRRRILLSQLAGAIVDVTQKNFGDTGVDRPYEWADLEEDYALEVHGGDQTPRLILTEDEHEKRHPGEPHMLDNFNVELGSDFAMITNLSPYASEHQEGLGRMYRPFFPVNLDGELTPAMQLKLLQITDSHFSYSSPP